MKQLARFAWRWIGPVVFLGLVWYVDLSRVGEVWKRGAAGLLLAAASLNIAIILVKTWRWRQLMQLQGIEYAYWPAVRYYAMGCAMAAWTPGRLGDFSKALAVHHERKIGLGLAASSVIADRLLDAVMLGVVASLGAFFLPGSRGIWLAAGGLAAVLVGIYFLLRAHRMGLARAGAARVVGALGAAGSEVGAAIDGLAGLARPGLAAPLGATAAATAITFLQGYLMARSLGLAVGFWVLSVALAAVSVTSLAPVSIAGLGTREATLALFLLPRGISMEEILGYSVAYFVIISGSVALIGAAAWMVRPATAAASLPSEGGGA
jgi:hypothetical protein